jgi:hypothetical protein
MKTVVPILCALVLLSCSSSRAPEAETGSAIAQLHGFESDFRPSDYEPDPLPPGQTGPRTVQADTIQLELPPTETPDAPVEMVSGYRVQVLSTTNIDTAKARKAEIELQLPGEWFYLDYDPPTYKIRAGNFQTRYEAERFARVLAHQGYPNAWAVPQRVFKNPPPPPASLPPELIVPVTPER